MPVPDVQKLCRWVYDWKEVDRFVSSLRRPTFGASARPLQDTGKGQIALLYQHLIAVRGNWPYYVQTIGDCVGHGYARAAMVLAATEIVLGEREFYVCDISSEDQYAGGRVEIGGGRLGNSDGSIGAWNARYITEYGTLLRQKYPTVDLTRYSGSRARSWGRRGAGVPDELEPIAREHPVRTVSLVTSYEEARDAIANGYPVPVCSMQGFRDKRDRDGFARPSGTWAHCMLFCGVDDESKRPGLLCDNSSWGPDWISGPKRHDQPEGTFWVDAEVADRMLRRDPDSYSLSGFEGYPDNSDTLTRQDFLDVWS